jgi:hypothetical protein
MQHYQARRYTRPSSEAQPMMLLYRCRRGVGLAALAGSLSASALAAGQAQQTESADSITVVGQRLSPEEARSRAIAFVRETGVAAGTRPMARWKEPVCPRALGLSPAHARIVEAKLRKVAEAANIRVAREPCRTNIAVSFAADAGTVVRTIQASSPGRLAEVPSSARAALLRGPAPIRWWYTTELRSRDGVGTSADAPLWAFVEGDGKVTNLPGDGTSLAHYSSSIVSTQVVRVLKSATVIVDVNLAEGLPLDAVTSYAALVAFAEIRNHDAAPPSSILGLLAKDGPRDLTDWDMTFLRALYRLPLDREARAQRGLLVRQLLPAGPAR